MSDNTTAAMLAAVQNGDMSAEVARELLDKQPAPPAEQQDQDTQQLVAGMRASLGTSLSVPATDWL